MLTLFLAGNAILAGNAVLKQPFAWNDAWTNPMLQGTTWKMTLDVGRVPGTRMPKDWAASGARLAVPMEITFTEDHVSDPAGAFRWLVEEPACCPARRIAATPGSFVSVNGEETVAVGAGGWLVEPMDRCGMSVLRWYIDFPEGAQRNDASLPAGRVFFRSACWDGEMLSQSQREAEAVQAKLTASTDAAAAASNLIERAQAVTSQDADTLRFHQEILERSLPDERGVIEGPGGLQVAAGGDLCIKAFPLGYRTIGRFSLKAV